MLKLAQTPRPFHPAAGSSMHQQPSMTMDRSMGNMSVNHSFAGSQSMEAGETPRKKDKKDKKDKSEKKEKKDKKDKKDKKRRGSSVSASRSFAPEDSN